MVINKRCGNCGKYPFCKKTNGAAGYCEEWIKRKLEVKDGQERSPKNSN